MISGLVTAWDGGDRGGAGQSAFFELEAGVDVNLGGGNTFVAESEADDGDVDVGVQKSHGGGVPQRVATWPGNPPATTAVQTHLRALRGRAPRNGGARLLPSALP